MMDMGLTRDGRLVISLFLMDSVLAEYRLGLENGELDPEEYLPKFIQALREAGIEKVIAEKQRQLDSWVAEK